jgi:translation initiation factor IF-2
VKSIEDENQKKLASARPSMPIKIIGLSKPAKPGESFFCVKSEIVAKEIHEMLINQQQSSLTKSSQTINLEDALTNLELKEEMNIIVCADGLATLEAVCLALKNLAMELGKEINIISSHIGNINETDLYLAAHAFVPIILGMNVEYSELVKSEAQKKNIELCTYNIIYELVDKVRNLITPKNKNEKKVIGRCKVKKLFDHSAFGKIAGCEILSGVVRINASVELIRDEQVIHSDKIISLRQRMQEVKVLTEENECGIALEKWSNFQIGDVLEILEA